MEGLKTILFYILGLAGLVVASSLLTGQVEIDIGELPPTARPIRPPRPTATRQPACLTTPGQMTYGYRPNAPLTTSLAAPDLSGQRLVISGTVYAADCITPLAGALLEIWHADANGIYDHTLPYILRGQLRTDEKGRYRFTTIKPGYDHIGQAFVPAHIHYRVSYQDQRVLSTQLFFSNDPFLTKYWTVFPDTIIPLIERTGPDGSILQGKFDLTVPVSP